jgi:hypothetical protein
MPVPMAVMPTVDRYLIVFDTFIVVALLQGVF